MPARLRLQVVQGASRDWQLQVANPASAVPWTDSNPSPFLGTDVLASVVSAGQDQPSLLAPTTTWVDYLAAIYQVSVSNAQTAALAIGAYRIQTTATRSARSGVIGNALLEVLAAAGTAAAIPVYAAYQDMLDYASWIGDLQDDNDDAGYLQQRGRARSWLDDILVSRYKPGGIAPALGTPGGFPFFMARGLDPWTTKWFRDILAANTGVGGSTALIVTDAVKEVVSKRALYYVLDDQVNRVDGTNPFKSLAREFRRDADGLLKTLRLEVDVSASGYGAYIINAGATNLR